MPTAIAWFTRDKSVRRAPLCIHKRGAFIQVDTFGHRRAPQCEKGEAIRGRLRGKMTLGIASSMDHVRRYDCDFATAKASVMAVVTILWRGLSPGQEQYALKLHWLW